MADIQNCLPFRITNVLSIYSNSVSSNLFPIFFTVFHVYCSLIYIIYLYYFINLDYLYSFCTRHEYSLSTNYRTLKLLLIVTIKIDFYYSISSSLDCIYSFVSAQIVIHISSGNS